MNAPSAPGIPKPETTQTAPLDQRVLAGLRALNPAGYPVLLQRLVKAYLGSSLTAVEALRTALAQGDRDALAKAAHGLKSSSGNMGATRLATLCHDVEQIGRGQSDADPTLTVAALQQEHHAVCEALQAEIAKVSGPSPQTRP